MDALDDALRVIASLNSAGVDYVVVDGVAMNVHGLVRATEHLDVFIRPDGENVERLKQALRALWTDPSIDEITAADLCGEYPVVRYGPPEGSLYLDIIARLGEVTSFADLEAEEHRIETVSVRVATPRTLYRMKRGTVRPIDHADAAALRAAFDLEDEEKEPCRSSSTAPPKKYPAPGLSTARTSRRGSELCGRARSSSRDRPFPAAWSASAASKTRTPHARGQL